jgi:Zn-dependent protease with chaperone function
LEYLVHIVLAVFVLAAAEQGLRTGWEAPWAVALLVVVPFVLGTYSRVLYLRGQFRVGQVLWRALHWSGPALYVLAVCVLGWSSTVERWTGMSTSLLGWPSPGLLLGFAPFVVYTLASIDVRVRHTEAAPDARNAARTFQIRMFASGLVPTVVFAIGAWLIGRNAVWRVHVEHVGLHALAFVVAAVSLFTLALPWILRASWDTEKLEASPLRTLLEDVSRHAKFRYRELRLWKTGGTLANAAVVGLGPFDRVVLFSDVLLAALTPREVVAVLAHEIGHAKRHHVAIFVVWTGGIFLAGDLVGREFDDEWIAAGLVLALFAAWYKLFGWLSRRFELEADLFALRLTRDPTAIVSALERVGGAHSREVDSWRHFSTAKRIAFVESAAVDERVGRRLEVRLRRLTWLGAIFCALALGASAWKLAADLPRDSVVAALALGEWGEAETAFARVHEPDPELAHWLSLVGELGADDRARPDIAVERARAALASGDAKLALDWLVIDALSLRPGSAVVRDALTEYVAAEAKELSEGRVPQFTPLAPRVGGWPEDWLAAARAHDARQAR